MALTLIERQLAEAIRKSKNVAISLDYGTPQETIIRVSGNCPHDIALAVQTMFNNEKRNKR